MVCAIFSACSNSTTKSESSTDSTAVAKKSLTSQTDSIIVANATGGTATFIVDTNTLKSDWQNFMNTQPETSPAVITHIEIIYANSQYYMRAEGTVNGVFMVSTMYTHTDPGTGHECLVIGGSDGYVVSCTTSACSSEALACFPSLSHCTPCSNKGKCTRTVSSSAALVFPSITPTACM